MPKVVKKKKEAMSCLPYSGAVAAKKNSSAKLTKKATATTAKRPPSKQIPVVKPKRRQQSSMKGFTWGKKQITEWKVDNPTNLMVLHLRDSGDGTQINIHELKERRDAATTMEGQAAMLAKNGDYEKAAQVQDHAEQLKARVSPEIERYFDVLEVAKKAAFAKNYWFGQKKFADMGKWDKVLKAAQHVAMLDRDNNPIAPPRARAGRPVRGRPRAA